MHTSCDSRTAIVFVSEGSERFKTATLSFKLNHVAPARRRRCGPSEAEGGRAAGDDGGEADGVGLAQPVGPAADEPGLDIKRKHCRRRERGELCRTRERDCEARRAARRATRRATQLNQGRAAVAVAVEEGEVRPRRRRQRFPRLLTPSPPRPPATPPDRPAL